MPCQLWANPTTSQPPVAIFASRNAASLDSAPVVNSSTLFRPGANPASASARSMTGRDSIPEKRWSSRPIISVTTATISGWECPRIGAHLATREVEHAPPGRVLDERTRRPARRRTAMNVAP